MFISQPRHYEFNAKQAASYTAAPAVLIAGDGTQEPGVVLHSLHTIQGVLPAAEALRLANEIADALASHRAEQEAK